MFRVRVRVRVTVRVRNRVRVRVRVRLRLRVRVKFVPQVGRISAWASMTSRRIRVDEPPSADR